MQRCWTTTVHYSSLVGFRQKYVWVRFRLNKYGHSNGKLMFALKMTTSLTSHDMRHMTGYNNGNRQFT